MPDEGKSKDKKTPSLQGIQETLEEAVRVSDDLIDGLEAAPVSAEADRIEDPKPRPRMDAEPRAALSDTLRQLDFLVEQAQSRLPPKDAPKRAPAATSMGGAQDIDDHLDALLGGPAGPPPTSRMEPAQPKPVAVAPLPPAPPKPEPVIVAPLPPAPPRPVTVAAPVPPAPQPMAVAPAPPAVEMPVPARAPMVPPVQALECEIADPLEALERSIPELITFKAPPRQPRRGIALAIMGGLILVAAATMWVRQAPSPVPSVPLGPAAEVPPVVVKTPEPSAPEPIAAPPPAVAAPKAVAPAPKAAAKPAKAPKRAAPAALREAPAVVVVVPEAATPPPPAAEPEPEPVAVAAPEPVEVVTAPASPPAVAAEESKVVAIPDPHQPPTLLRRVAPEIPAGTLKAGERHTVLLSALVDEQGRVVRVVVEEGLPGQRPLEAAAVNALLRWTFRPALEDGRPVRDWVTEKIVLEP